MVFSISDCDRESLIFARLVFSTSRVFKYEFKTYPPQSDFSNSSDCSALSFVPHAPTAYDISTSSYVMMCIIARYCVFIVLMSLAANEERNTR